MKFRTLKKDEDLMRYSKSLAPYIDVELPLEYLKRSKVVACLDGDTICGGFVIVKKGPFRVLDSIPAQNDEIKRYNGSKKVAEVTGLWLSHRMIKKKKALAFWIKLVTALIFSRKTMFTYAYSLKKPKIGRMYSCAKPKVLFRGLTKVLPGMPNTDHESIEILALRNLLLAPFKAPNFFVKRLLGVRRQPSLSTATDIAT